MDIGVGASLDQTRSPGTVQQTAGHVWRLEGETCGGDAAGSAGSVPL